MCKGDEANYQVILEGVPKFEKLEIKYRSTQAGYIKKAFMLKKKFSGKTWVSYIYMYDYPKHCWLPVNHYSRD